MLASTCRAQASGSVSRSRSISSRRLAFRAFFFTFAALRGPGGVPTQEPFSQATRWPTLDTDRAEGCIRSAEHAFSPEGGLAVVMGDVAGRGIQAAAVMGQLQNAVRAYAAEGYGPAMILQRVGRMQARPVCLVKVFADDCRFEDGV